MFEYLCDCIELKSYGFYHNNTHTHIEFLWKKRRENKLHTGFECGFRIRESCIISDVHAYNFRLKLYIVCPIQIKTLYISKVMIYSTRDYKVEFVKKYQWTNEQNSKFYLKFVIFVGFTCIFEKLKVFFLRCRMVTIMYVLV